jgi:hypothetical protein
MGVNAMTKLVPLRSVEHGIRRALTVLDDDTAQGAIEEIAGVHRSVSLLRKCADPDNDRHHLQFRYAIALDAGCARAGYIAPLLEVHQYLVESYSDPATGNWNEPEAKLLHAVLNLQAALGELSQTVSEGMHEKGPGGARLTNREKHAIHKALEAIDYQTEALKRSIST